MNDYLIADATFRERFSERKNCAGPRFAASCCRRPSPSVVITLIALLLLNDWPS